MDYKDILKKEGIAAAINQIFIDYKVKDSGGIINDEIQSLLEQSSQKEKEAFEAAREFEDESTGESMQGVGWEDAFITYPTYQDYLNREK